MAKAKNQRPDPRKTDQFLMQLTLVPHRKEMMRNQWIQKHLSRAYQEQKRVPSLCDGGPFDINKAACHNSRTSWWCKNAK